MPQCESRSHSVVQFGRIIRLRITNGVQALAAAAEGRKARSGPGQTNAKRLRQKTPCSKQSDAHITSHGCLARHSQTATVTIAASHNACLDSSPTALSAWNWIHTLLLSLSPVTCFLFMLGCLPPAQSVTAKKRKRLELPCRWIGVFGL